MVDFYEVHGKAVEGAKGKIRSGDIWNVALREPLPKPTVGAIPETMGTIIRFREMPDGLLEPATERDRQEIYEWNRRHRNTPRETFQLPALRRS